MPASLSSSPVLLRLSDVIHGGANNRDGNCLAFVSPYRNLSDGCQVSRMITYQQARRILQKHRQWLQRIIRHSFVVDNYTTIVQEQQDPTNNNDPKMATTKTLVAYISGNSPDFFLSVLASSDESSTFIATALLNTRWSPQEIVQIILQHSNPRDATILLLYGPSFRDKAEAVVLGLQGGRRGQHKYKICCKPIPEFCCHAQFQNKNNIISDRSLPPPPLPSPEALKRLDPIQEIKRLSRLRCTLAEKVGQLNKGSDRHSDRDALFLFTSGTTSGSKGVRLSHCALLIQALAKMAPPCSISAKSRIVASTGLPFYHVGGLTNLLAVWLAGGTLLFRCRDDVYDGDGDAVTVNLRGGTNSFDARFLWQSMATRQPWNCNTLVVVPAMIHMLMQQVLPNSGDDIFPHVDLVLIGGQSAPPVAQQFLRRHFPKARLVQTYACTEASSSLTYHDLSSMLTSTNGNGILPQSFVKGTTRTTITMNQSPTGDCVGRPPDHVKIALFPAFKYGDNVQTINPGRIIKEPFQVGLIATRGPHMMNGYWSRNSSLAPSLPLGNSSNKSNYCTEWFVSSDLGYWDTHQNLYFCGRASDTIRTGGETVLAPEVERVLQQHAGIDEVAVFSMPDDRFGEKVACAVVLKKKDEQDLGLMTLGQLQSWCKTHGLARYKCPRSLFMVQSLPRNSTGKVLKSELKKMFGQGQRNGEWVELPRSRL